MMDPESKRIAQQFLTDKHWQDKQLLDCLCALEKHFKSPIAAHKNTHVVSNLTLWRDRAIHALERAKAQDTKLSILTIEANDPVPQTKDSSNRLDLIGFFSQQIQPSQTLLQLSPNQFILLLEDIRSHNEISQIAESMIRNCIDLQHPAEANQWLLHIGISVFPNDGDNIDYLIEFSKSAQKHASKIPGNNFLFYSPSLERLTAYQVSAESDLRHAFVNSEITLHYQPRYDSKTRQIIGTEALMRWVNPSSGKIGPLQFLSVAEKSGIIIEIGEWSLEHALAQLREWHDAGFDELTMSVNLSSRQLHDSNLVEHLSNLLDLHNLDGQFLEIEIKESSFKNLTSKVIEQLEAIHNIGVKLSWDDFGTGNSSLSALFKLPFDTVKIENSVVDKIKASLNGKRIVRSLIALAHHLQLDVTAEGVENKESLNHLIDSHCDALQGYYFSEPLPPEEVSELLLTQAERKREAS